MQSTKDLTNTMVQVSYYEGPDDTLFFPDSTLGDIFFDAVKTLKKVKKVTLKTKEDAWYFVELRSYEKEEGMSDKLL